MLGICVPLVPDRAAVADDEEVDERRRTLTHTHGHEARRSLRALEERTDVPRFRTTRDHEPRGSVREPRHRTFELASECRHELTVIRGDREAHPDRHRAADALHGELTRDGLRDRIDRRHDRGIVSDLTDRARVSSDDLVQDAPVDVGQSEVATAVAIGELLVVETQ